MLKPTMLVCAMLLLVAVAPVAQAAGQTCNPVEFTGDPLHPVDIQLSCIDPFGPVNAVVDQLCVLFPYLVIC
jgi:hypothetical protein